jgi:hypothetical protein
MSGWYSGGVLLVSVVWLAYPKPTAALAPLLYCAAIGACLSRLCRGPDRPAVAGWLLLTVLMLARAMEWLPSGIDVFALQVALGCLLIVPAFQWSIGARSFFPPPEGALAALLVIAQCLLLVLLESHSLHSIGRFAEVGFAVILLCWCCSMAWNGRRSAWGLATGQDGSEDAKTDAVRQRELLRDAILAVRACHTVRLVHRGAHGPRDRNPDLVKAA